MNERPVLLPDAGHPISVEPTRGRVRVWLGERLIADTTRALTLCEGGNPPVYYISRSDIDADVFDPSDHATYCPYKGEAAYHGLRTENDTVLADTSWYYPNPHAAVAEIIDHIAFYPDAVRVEISEN